MGSTECIEETIDGSMGMTVFISNALWSIMSVVKNVENPFSSTAPDFISKHFDDSSTRIRWTQARQ